MLMRELHPRRVRRGAQGFHPDLYGTMSITVARQAPGLPVGLKFVVVLALAAGVAGWLEPRLFENPRALFGQLLQRAQLELIVVEPPQVRGDIMAIQKGPDGAVWVTSKNEVVRYLSSATEDAQKLLNADAYQKSFGRRMDALSTIHVSAADEAWVGTWYGGVLHYRDGDWVALSDRGTGPGDRITAILDLADVVYVGGRGLWAWSPSLAALRPVDGFPGDEVTVLARSAAAELLVGTRDGVLVRRAGRWQRLWDAGRDDVEVSAIFVTATGEILVATHDGYVVLDQLGQPLYRELAGRWVTDFAESRNGELWVGTRQEGIHLRVDGAWWRLGHAQGLADDGLSALMVDGRGRLWMGIYGDGLSVAGIGALRTFATRQQVASTPDSVETFVDVCEAAATRLGAVAESGGVAVDTIDGRLTVFFNGHQVCPGGVGYRRDAETLVTVADSAVKYRVAGEQRLLPLPARAVAAVPTASFVDSLGRLWLGFRRRGLFVYDDGRWYAFGEQAELADNPVKAIGEDASGAIWLATSPRFDYASGEYTHAGLHRYDTQGWRHFRPVAGDVHLAHGKTRQGLSAAPSNALRILADGRIAVATNGGLSIYDDGVFKTYSSATVAGLESNFIADVVEDYQGDLWLTHAFWGHGVTRKDGLAFHNRNARDGLFHDHISRLAFDANGNVWMQSSYGKTAIYPRDAIID